MYFFFFCNPLRVNRFLCQKDAQNATTPVPTTAAPTPKPSTKAPSKDSLSLGVETGVKTQPSFFQLQTKSSSSSSSLALLLTLIPGDILIIIIFFSSISTDATLATAIAFAVVVGIGVLVLLHNWFMRRQEVDFVKRSQGDLLGEEI